MSSSPDITELAKRILIVDDNDDNREVLGIILGHEGFVATGAGTGEEALAILEQQPLDLILLDILLPGMSGYETAAAMKRNPATKDIPIIMLTGMNDVATKLRALGSGADDFLSKPLDRTELCLRVRNLLLVKERAARAAELLQREI
jgi:CheY-like chemotaxis protein